MIIASHIDKYGNVEDNDRHQQEVATLASRYAEDIGLSEWCYAAGIIHDVGKARPEFQRHILFGSTEECHHAYVGALIAKKLYPRRWPLLSNAIAGHHRGLYNQTDLADLMTQKTCPCKLSNNNVHVEPLELPLRIYKPGQDWHHIQRMIYSCLVDADRIATEAFCDPDRAAIRTSESLLVLKEKLGRYIKNINDKSPKTKINSIRRDVQSYCMTASEWEPGIYSLTVPTGGGKTISSLVWAINHAVKYGKKRIIIAIPYTSIIMQTASILRQIFGADNVLEHHSDYVCENNDDTITPLELAMDNWNYPIIVTTNVRLMESIYSSKPSPCRKIHNIANSVIILDEAQALPVGYRQSIIDAMDTYTRLFGTSWLLTTASQPLLSGDGNYASATLRGIKGIKEIIPSERHLHKELNRVNIDDIGDVDVQEISRKLSEHSTALCIVNTRMAAVDIYDTMLGKEGVYCLSKNLLRGNILKVLDAVKKRLDRQDPVILITTPLVEAGVDIDFPVVYRQYAGLDNVIQAAGRCNRHGILPKGTTYMFGLKGYHLPPELSRANAARMAIKGDYMDPDTIRKYNKQLYSRVTDFDVPKVQYYLYNTKNIMYQTASEHYHLIDDSTVPVIIPAKGCTLETDDLRHLLRERTVQVTEYILKELKKTNTIKEWIEGVWILTDATLYNDNTGLRTP